MPARSHKLTQTTYLPSLVAHTGVKANVLHDARVDKAECQVWHASQTTGAGDLQMCG